MRSPIVAPSVRARRETVRAPLATARLWLIILRRQVGRGRALRLADGAPRRARPRLVGLPCPAAQLRLMDAQFRRDIHDRHPARLDALHGLALDLIREILASFSPLDTPTVGPKAYHGCPLSRGDHTIARHAFAPTVRAFSFDAAREHTGSMAAGGDPEAPDVAPSAAFKGNKTTCPAPPPKPIFCAKLELEPAC